MCMVKGRHVRWHTYTQDTESSYILTCTHTYSHTLYSHAHTLTHTDNSLDVTLNRLVVLLREKVGPKWRDFGEALDIDDVVLDSIAKTCFPENCIVEVLDYWLKYTDEKITWREVAYVLKSINFHELALDVVQIYKTGTIIIN